MEWIAFFRNLSINSDMNIPLVRVQRPALPLRKLPIALGVASTFLAVAVFAADIEDVNDTPAGAEEITPPDSRGQYFINAKDSDWFRVSKGPCDALTVSISSVDPISLDGANTLMLYRDTPTPQLISSVDTVDDPTNPSGVGFFDTIGTLRYEGKGETSVLVRVYRDNPSLGDVYGIEFETSSINALIQKKINKAESKVKKMQKRLKKIRLPGAKRNYAKRIKKAKKKIKVLKRRLCV